MGPILTPPKAGGTIDPLSQYGALLGLGLGALLPSLFGNNSNAGQTGTQGNQQQGGGIAGLLSQLGGGSGGGLGAMGGGAATGAAAPAQATTPQGTQQMQPGVPQPVSYAGTGYNPALAQQAQAGNPLLQALKMRLATLRDPALTGPLNATDFTKLGG